VLSGPSDATQLKNETWDAFSPIPEKPHDEMVDLLQRDGLKLGE
jgi:hypothetical protein